MNSEGKSRDVEPAPVARWDASLDLYKRLRETGVPEWEIDNLVERIVNEVLTSFINQLVAKRRQTNLGHDDDQPTIANVSFPTN